MSESTLPCGRLRADLLRLAADGSDSDPGLAEHASACPHCAAELTALHAHWKDVRAAAARPTPTPRGLADRMVGVLRGVRGTPETWHTAADGVRVADHVVVMIARRIAADAVAGAAHVRTVHTEGDTVHIGLAIHYGVPADVLAARVRAAVLAGLGAHVGPVAGAVDVQVTDVLPPPIG